MENEMYSEEYRGCTIRIYLDDIHENPITEWDMLGTFVCFHSRYDLSNTDYFKDADFLREFLDENDVIWLPLYLYEHGGISISTEAFSCPWDSGQIGVVYVEHDRVLKEYGVNGDKVVTEQMRQRAIDCLQSEVKTFDQYLRGEVYGYQTEDSDGENIDSCWGYYGDYANELYGDDYILGEARGSIDYHLEQEKKTHFEQLKIWIKNRVPLHRRYPCPVI